MACMTREQVANLVVGQEVKIRTRGPRVYICPGKVIKITDTEVEALVDLRPPTLFRFGKDGKETDESVDDRGFGIDPDCGPWHIEQDETVN